MKSVEEATVSRRATHDALMTIKERRCGKQVDRERRLIIELAIIFSDLSCRTDRVPAIKSEREREREREQKCKLQTEPWKLDCTCNPSTRMLVATDVNAC